MTTITLYHNPRCSKSRQALALIEAKGHSPKVIEYLKEPLTIRQLVRLCKQLQCEPMDMVRRNEPEYATSGLADLEEPTHADVCEAIAEYPKLMQRPIVVYGERAVIARPAEEVTALI